MVFSQVKKHLNMSWESERREGGGRKGGRKSFRANNYWIAASRSHSNVLTPKTALLVRTLRSHFSNFNIRLLRMRRVNAVLDWTRCSDTFFTSHLFWFSFLIKDPIFYFFYILWLKKFKFWILKNIFCFFSFH